MRLLLDTHAFLWFVLGDDRCSVTARSLIEDEANEKWLSPASHWELAIKISLGKYHLPSSFREFINRAVYGRRDGCHQQRRDTGHVSNQQTMVTVLSVSHRLDPFLPTPTVLSFLPLMSRPTAPDRDGKCNYGFEP